MVAPYAEDKAEVASPSEISFLGDLLAHAKHFS